MWGPGGGAGFTYAWTGSLDMWPFSLGMGVHASGSSGTVSGNVEGQFNVSYDNYLDAPGISHVDLQFGGLTDESKLITRLGLAATLDPRLYVDLLWPIPDIDLHPSLKFNTSFNTNTDFTYSEFGLMQGRGEWAPGLTLGADIWVAGVSTQPYFFQNVYFEPGGVTGTLVYTHLGTGTTGSVGFSTNDQGWTALDLPLNLPGYWALSVQDLDLAWNGFYTDIGYAGNITMWAALVGSVSWNLDLDIYRSDTLELKFNELDRLPGSLLVDVGDWNGDTPEPRTVVLLASGLIALFGVRRGWKCSA